MDDDSSFEEDFSEITFLTTTEEESTPPQKKDTNKDNNSFEILSTEHILQEVFRMVLEVRSFLGVNIYRFKKIHNMH